MKLEKLLESKSASLYHAVPHKYILDQLANDRIIAATIHRNWKDGLRYSREDKNYDKHVWIKGLSLSRDINFCLSWNPYIYELDQEKLCHNYKLLTINWLSKSRREAEEFLWMDTSNISGDGAEVVRYSENGKAKLNNLHKYLKKIIISKKRYIKGSVSFEKTIDDIKVYCEKYNIPYEER